VGQNIHFDGSGSYDPDGDTLSYKWDFGDGTSSGWQSDSSAYHIYSILGNYTINLTVSGGLFSDVDSCIVYVNWQNQAPNADAGPDKIADQYVVVDFNGSGSTDDVGIVNFTWIFTYNNILWELYGMNPEFTFDNPGVYPVTLLVKDMSGLFDTDTMTVTVLDIETPQANAGADQVVGQYTTVAFNGIESTDNVGIANYTWNFTYAGKEIILQGPIPHYKFDIMGEYVSTLKVSDTTGLWDIDEMVVIVLDMDPPIAVADSDNNVEINEIVYFDGSASIDNNGVIDNYTWTFTYNSDVILLYGANTSFMFEKVGLYEVTLTVWDPSNNYASDTSWVIVASTDSDDGDTEPDEKEPFFIPSWIFLILVVIIIILVIALYLNKERKKKSEEIASEPTEQNSVQQGEQNVQQPDESSLHPEPLSDENEQPPSPDE
jgi:PKD repeat protein